MMNQDYLTQLVSLIFAVVAFLQGDVRFEYVSGPIIARDEVHRTAENPEGAYEAQAKVRCDNGHPTITFSKERPPDIIAVVHELLHAAACKADGKFLPHNVASSIDPTECREVPTDCLHSFVYWALRNPQNATEMLRRLSVEQR